jgi:hypothetical protein
VYYPESGFYLIICPRTHHFPSALYHLVILKAGIVSFVMLSIYLILRLVVTQITNEIERQPEFSRLPK